MALKYVTQTRLKIVVLGVALFLVEGLIRTFLVKFPFIEVVSGQSGLIIGYITGKTAGKKYDCEGESHEFTNPENITK